MRARSQGQIAARRLRRALLTAMVVVMASSSAQADLSSRLPSPEIVWGGTSSAFPDATGSPFAVSSQVISPPVVADLTGDGIPEIVFSSYCGSSFRTDGILRAIHGGGPNKGGDYFATCGDVVWHEGDPLPITCSCTSAALNPSAGIAVADLDGDGLPEIVAATESGGIQILDNTGEVLSTSGTVFNYSTPAPSIANIDHQGLPEILMGRDVFTLDIDPNGVLQILDRFSGVLSAGRGALGPISCLADLGGGSGIEIIAGPTVYALPHGPSGVTRQSECTGGETNPEEVAFCSGALLVVWDATTVNPGTVPDGLCAIADVWGADTVAAPGPLNPPDGQPEVLLVAGGDLWVLDALTGEVLRRVSAGLGANGGSPVVADFDGDGFPEIGAGFASRYAMFDLQDTSAACPAWLAVPASDFTSVAAVNPSRSPPVTPCSSDADCSSITAGTTCNERTGTCICLHNGWQRVIEDDASRSTGSTAFDFDEDGAAELLYNDECRARLYDGRDGTVWMREPSESRTRIELPLAADVDSDGQAEWIFVSSDESAFCSERLTDQYNNGIEIWGDVDLGWGNALGIWNQHAYHVDNVGTDSSIPIIELPSWTSHNSYRANVPPPAVLPDPNTSACEIQLGMCLLTDGNGDINRDGILDVLDSVLFRRILAGASVP